MIKRIHRRGIGPDPLKGLFSATIGGKDVVVEYEPDNELRDTEQVPLIDLAGSRDSYSGRCCRTQMMPGLCLGT